MLNGSLHTISRKYWFYLIWREHSISQQKMTTFYFLGGEYVKELADILILIRFQISNTRHKNALHEKQEYFGVGKVFYDSSYKVLVAIRLMRFR